MLAKGQTRTRIKTTDLEGMISTNFEIKSLVTNSGVEFVAEIETKRGRSKVKYLVRHDNLEDMDESEWGPWLHFDSSKPYPASTAHLN
jgi:hypothetical protein